MTAIALSTARAIALIISNAKTRSQF